MLFLGPRGLGELSGLRKQMASPEWGFREMEGTQMSSHVGEFVQSLCVPHNLHPLTSSTKADSAPCPPSGPAGAVGRVAVLLLLEGQGSVL